ncbi:MAG: hypothetical protein ROM54_11635 [Anaerobiospirillum sp.]|nr:hypothetical protein [Anaerobiospirillum sp.]
MEKLITAVIVLLIAIPCYFGLRRIARQLVGKAKSCGCSSGSSCADHATCDHDQADAKEHHCNCDGECHCHSDLSCDKAKS